MIFTPAELDYLTGQPLGRLATVSPAGQVPNNPVNFVVDAGAGTITIGGGALGASKKFRDLQQGSTAVARTDQEPPLPGLSAETITITPTRIISWGIDGPRSSRKA